VVIAHGLDAFYWPDDSFDRPYYFLTLPILRLSFQGGFLAVTIFFVISGYVCAMKPLKLSRARKPDEARKAIASAAFRRILRLGAPATLATCISWTMDRFGAFHLAKSFPDSLWINRFSPPEYPNFSAALTGLFHSCVNSISL
jgi:peptidoglycan/LPS O-acetylase OafA/YrhL